MNGEMIVKRIISLALTLVLVLGIFSACSPRVEESIAPESKDEVSVETSEEIVDTRYKANVPDVDYEGEDIVILASYGTAGAVNPEYGGDGTTELVADVINVAIDTRNSIVEEALGVDIVEMSIIDTDRMGGGSTFAKVQGAVNSSIYDFDMCSTSLFNLAALGKSLYLEDLMGLEYLHELEEPWWHKYFTNEVKIMGSVYFASGDISYYNTNATAAILFNKELFSQYDIEDPYQVVRDKKWTLDKLATWQKTVSIDEDNNGTINHLDKATISSSYDMIWAQFFSCGGRIVSKDENNNPILSIYSERNDSVIEKIQDIMHNDNYIVYADELGAYATTSVGALVYDMFMSGRSMMHIGSVATIDKIKDTPYDFGILPYPMFDETQEDYYSFLNPWVGNAISIPWGMDDETLKMISIVMESMGAEGKNELTPQFYEVALKRQNARDDESQEMLDIISATVGCDFGQLSNLAGYPSMLHQLINSEKGSFFSKYEALKNKAEGELKAIVDAYSK